MSATMTVQAVRGDGQRPQHEKEVGQLEPPQGIGVRRNYGNYY
jgi:hypothetical protein